MNLSILIRQTAPAALALFVLGALAGCDDDDTGSAPAGRAGSAGAGGQGGASGQGGTGGAAGAGQGGGGAAGQGGGGPGGQLVALDPSFGKQGVVVLEGSAPSELGVNALALGADGAIFVVRGESGEVVRLRTDGSLDPAFGKAGVADVAPQKFSGRALIALPDGKLVVAGELGDFSLFTNAFVRLGADGKLDPTFGEGGVSPFPVAMGGGPKVHALALQGERVVAAGSNVAPPVIDPASFVLRLDPAGNLDTSFHAPDGFLSYHAVDPTPDPQDAPVDIVTSLFVRADGSLLAGGRGRNMGRPEGDFDFLTLALGSDGTLEPGYGEGGALYVDHLLLPALSGNFGGGVAETPDGKIALAGTSSSSEDTYGPVTPSRAWITRRLPDGGPDTSFAGDGFFELDVPESAAFSALVALPDGSLVAAGTLRVDGEPLTPVLVRVRADGTLDPAFGEGGVARLPGIDNALVEQLARQADGRFVLGGRALNFPTDKPFVARVIVP
jgi:uncharacterized delta-60 repeat protein